MSKLLLVTAPRPESGPLHFGDSRPPLGLGHVAAAARQAGHEVRVLDLYAFGGAGGGSSITANEAPISGHCVSLDTAMADFQPDAVGMYVHTLSYLEAIKVAKRLRADYPGIALIAGGPHAIVLPYTLRNHFDIVVSGEGEPVIDSVLRNRGQFRRPASATRPLILFPQSVSDMACPAWPDMDDFWPLPYNWWLEVFDHQFVPVFPVTTSRGCPFSCNFCGVKDVYAGYRTTPANTLIHRLTFLAEAYNVRTFYFREDCFTADQKRLAAFCKMLIEYQLPFHWVAESRVGELSAETIALMAQAGCLGLYVGVESGSPAILEKMHKGETVGQYREKFALLGAAGIATYATWLYGVGETQEDRQMSRDLRDELAPTTSDSFVWLGIPFSPLYRELARSGEYEFLDYETGFLYPKGWLSLARQLYGEEDRRAQHVTQLYEAHHVIPVEVKW